MSKSSKREARVITMVLTLLVLPAIVFSVVPDTAAEWWLNLIMGCVLGAVGVFFLFVLVRSYLQ